MKTLKLILSGLTIAFAILGLTKAISTDISMPITFFCLALTEGVMSYDTYKNRDKKGAVLYLMLAILLIAVTIYNVVSNIFGI